MEARIELTKSAIFELISAAIEAYVYRHDYSRTIAVETFAYLFGTVKKRLPLRCTVEHVSVETSAKKRRGSVRVKNNSYTLKRELAHLFGPGFDFIGSMHSHPWVPGEVYQGKPLTSPDDIRKHQLYLLSDADHRCEIGRHFSVGKRNFSLAMTVTLFAMKRANDRADHIYSVDDNLYEFTIGNLKFWFYMQAFEHVYIDNITDEQAVAFEKYGLKLSDYLHHDPLPIPISTFFEKTDLINTFLMESFGRFRVCDESKTGIYLNTEKAEKRRR